MKKKKLIIALSIIFSLLAVIVISMSIYLNTYYHSTNDAEIVLDNPKVDVSYGNDYIEFNGNSDKALIFYPGGKVEYTAYAPLMEEIASNGITCYLVKMPFNLAFFDINAANEIINNNDKINEWYIGGHSLGGVAASSYASKHDNIEGLVLLASYSTKQINCKSLSIYGSCDGVLNLKSYEKNKSNLSDNIEFVIEGGNHGQFGSYGFQKGDNCATITSNQQKDITALKIKDFIK